MRTPSLPTVNGAAMAPLPDSVAPALIWAEPAAKLPFTTSAPPLTAKEPLTLLAPVRIREEVLSGPSLKLPPPPMEPAKTPGVVWLTVKS